MNQLIWRLHRGQAYFATSALAAFALILAITGVVMANDYHRFLATCALTHSCSDGQGELFSGDGAIFDIVNLTIVVPLLFGLFWGAPLVSKELEDGTHNLMWTQGVTRRRWLSTNVAWCLGAAAIWGAAISILVLWWRVPENALGSRFDAFDQVGNRPDCLLVVRRCARYRSGFFLQASVAFNCHDVGCIRHRARSGRDLPPAALHGTPDQNRVSRRPPEQSARWFLGDLAGPRESARPRSRARIDSQRPACGLSSRSIRRQGLDCQLPDVARLPQCHHISAGE